MHPLALDLLEKAHLDTSGLRSKSWDEFAKSGAPEMDFVFTVCDHAASEVCPAWPGNPVTAHWASPTPPLSRTRTPNGPRLPHAFQALETRIELFASLRLEALDRLAIKREVDEIGHLRVVTSGELALVTSVATVVRAC